MFFHLPHSMGSFWLLVRSLKNRISICDPEFLTKKTKKFKFERFLERSIKKEFLVNFGLKFAMIV
jgi:hypothetical protein